MRTHRTVTVALTAGLVLLGAAGTAAADTAASPAPGAGAHSQKALRHVGKPKKDGARALCKRESKIDKRLDLAIRRLDGDSGVRGSVARLEKRVANAKAAHHTAVGTYLNHRLTTRRSMEKTVKERKDDLKGVASWCAKQDFAKKGSGKDAGDSGADTSS
ncbi:hypothetical protein ACFV3R_06420 [Streptomyces sp. NPDC059740]|uniref:hypothetical protein n=1 Tax=Streptomyces sp. NPDC059740 TaxID=3346926 RepID=UPI0036507187